MGAIQDAILDTLTHSGALRPRDVQHRVEERLGRLVSRDTVTSFLSVAARDPRSAVTRVGAVDMSGLMAFLDRRRVLARAGALALRLRLRRGRAALKLDGD